MPTSTAFAELDAPSATLRLRVEGMSCASCVGRVENALKALPGVTRTSVNLVTERAVVDFSVQPDPLAVIGAVKTAGYEVVSETAELLVEGMSCASCVGRVEKVLKALPGVLDASVNLATEKARIDYLGGSVSTSDMIAAVASAGYGARTVTKGAVAKDEEAARREREMRSLRNALLLAAVLTVPVVVLEMGSHLVSAIHMWVMETIGQKGNWYLQFALTTLVLFGPGLRFFVKGVPALLRGGPDMNTLVSLGTGAAWAYSVVATFAPGLLPEGTHSVYYEAATVIVALILLGRWLEARAKGRTSEAIKQLVGLQAKTAQVLRDGKVVQVSPSEVVAGDIVQVRPGERVPVDGEVLDGSSFIDESMITGEPIPIQKSVGAAVVGGTINKTGSITFRADKVGGDTVLAQIIRMVEEAQGSKLPIQALVDRVTGVFVPIVMGIAALTFVVWLVFGPDPALAFALVNGVSVLIIACPCAMGLATPTSIMVGTGRAARMGVLFRKGEALQTLRGAKAIGLDKTGTLTKGRPELTDLSVVGGFQESDVLSLVAAVEERSEHPIAEAIVTATKQRNLAFGSVQTFESVPGFGVAATVDGRQVEIGADRYMKKLGYDLAEVEPIGRRLASQGKSPLYAAIDGRLAAAIAVADPIKPTTRDSIAALHQLGIKVAMITGDNAGTANAIATQLGIDEVMAEVLPDGKVEAIKALRQHFGAVAFVGDGINDAPALAEADVGIAIGTGTDVAIEAADVVLMSGDLRGVVNAIALSKATIRNIQQNLFWAFAYNASLIPVAAGVLYPFNGTLLSPIFAAGAMAASSVFVLGNALRLKRFQPPMIADTAPAMRAHEPTLVPAE